MNRKILNFTCAIAALGLTALSHASILPPKDECGTVLNFDGIDDYVSVGHNDALNFSSDDAFSIEAWFKTEENLTILSKADGSTPYQGYQLLVVSDGSIAFGLTNSLATSNFIEVRSTTLGLKDGEWHHVVCTYDGSKDASGVAMYVDGIKETNNVTGNSLTLEMANTFPFQIGGRDGKRLAEGAIAEVGVWKKVLTDLEADETFSNGINPEDVDLVAFYDFNEGTGRDYVKNHVSSDLMGNLMNFDLISAWTLSNGNMGGDTYQQEELEITYGDSIMIGGAYVKESGLYYDSLMSTSGCDSIVQVELLVVGPPNDQCGTVLNFDGMDDYIQLDKVLTIGTSSNTVELWVKVPKVNTQGLITSERVGNILGNFDSSPNANWEIHNAGNIRVFWNGGQIDKKGTTDLRDDEWHHLAFVRNKEEGKFVVYIDGEIELEHSSAGSDITFSEAHRIGGDLRNGTQILFHGSMDELRIWNVAKTQTEIVDGMRNMLLGSESGLVSYYDFNDGETSSKLSDKTATENDGMLSNNMDVMTSWQRSDGSEDPRTFAAFNEEVCDSIYWNGTYLTESNTYTFMIQNAAGCDSIITLDLTVNETPDSSVTVDETVLMSNAVDATYTWIDCNNDNAPIGESTQSITAPSGSSYAVIVSKDGCTATSRCNTILVTETDSYDGLFEVYPNPSNGSVSISFGDTYTDVTIKVVDITGQIVQTSYFDEAALANLELGANEAVYFIEISTESGLYKHVKLVVE